MFKEFLEDWILLEKEFGAHKKKQNAQFNAASHNAEMQANKATKAMQRAQKVADKIRSGVKPEELTGQYKDWMSNEAFRNDVEKLIGGANSSELQTVSRHAKSATANTGRTGQIATKMSKQRRSLAQGGELNIQGNDVGQIQTNLKKGTRSGGRSVTLKDVRDKNTGARSTVVETNYQKVPEQGGKKVKVKQQAVLDKPSQQIVDNAAKGPTIVDASGKKVQQPKVNRPVTVVETPPATSVTVTTPKSGTTSVVSQGANTTPSVINTPHSSGAPKPKPSIVNSNATKKGTSSIMDHLKRNKKAYLVGGSLAVAGTGLAAYRHYKNKKKENEN